MPNKTKTSRTFTDQVADAATVTGVALMAGAVTLGLVDIPANSQKRAVLPVRPIFEPVVASVNGEGGSVQMRRERDETAPHYVSYNVFQRTPGRTGKY